jgi:ubiquinone/menaquinone biosynthesis C-methylase UbiE
MNKYEEYSIKKYDSIAWRYDNSPDGRFTAPFKRRMLVMCRVSDGDRVLDVGCGNGSLISALKRKGEIHAYGVDLSPNMIKESRKRYKDIWFEVSNGEKLPFENSSLNTITICCVLHHLNNPRNFFVEAKRVLQTGGTLIVGEPWYPFGLRQLADWVVSPLLKAGDNKIFSHKRLKQFFTDFGFAITETYKKGTMQIVMGEKSKGRA